MTVCKRHGIRGKCHKCRDIRRQAGLKRDAMRWRKQQALIKAMWDRWPKPGEFHK